MKVVSITEAKNGLSALIDGLANGDSVLITDRGRPVARLEPAVDLDEIDPSGKLARLVRKGIVRPPKPRSGPAKELPPPPKPREGNTFGVLDALLEERRTGW